MMNTFATRHNDLENIERSTRRLENGVEILERETISTIRIVDGHFVTNPNSRQSRLVIGENPPAANTIIAKKRSELSELDTFLRSITKPREKVK